MNSFNPTQSIKVIALALVTLLLVGCQSTKLSGGSEATKYDAEIRWTSYGIPHVKASTWAGLGYGYAYATAEDAVCVIAQEVMLVSGEQAKYQGSDDGRLQSDIFHKAFLNSEVLQHYTSVQSENSKDFSQGYAKGYNRFLRDHLDTLPVSCRGKSWVRPITESDVIRMTIGAQVRYGLAQFQRGIVNAQRPGLRNTYPSSTFSPLSGIGSNGVALGREVTASGRGMLLGNPHYPWRGPSRFHLIHTTIPGELDVMGVSLMTTTRILIGFNKDVAWTHTVSAAMRANAYELSINPENSMQYLFENEYRDIETKSIEVEVLDSANRLNKELHQIYLSHLGPILVSREFPWTTQRAYAIQDANIFNNRHDETYDALHVAKNIDDVETALGHQGVAVANTIAADRHGTAFYADMAVTPNLDAKQLSDCRLLLADVPAYFVVLSGDRESCEWKDDSRARIPNVMPAEEMPRLRRDDYVLNANNSYWLTNPDEPLEGFSPTLGTTHTARSLRTRAGIAFVEELISQGKVSPGDLQDMLFSHRNYAAELLLDDILELCTASVVNIARACIALKSWDRTMNLDSRGSQVWTEFWKNVAQVPDLWAIPYDDRDPANTPSGIALDNSAVNTAIIDGLRAAQSTLDAAEIPLDEALRKIQYSTTPDGAQIPIPGGSGRVGMFSMTVAPLQQKQGYTPIVGGNSFIQVVSWNKAGDLDARGVLTYSQSQEADSPHSSDFTRLYSKGGWLKFPFTDAEIDADPALKILHLAE